VTLEDEIGDGPLTFILILKSCGVWDLNLPSTFSSSNFLPYPSYSTLLPNLLLTPPTSS